MTSHNLRRDDESNSEYLERVEKAERQASWSFNRATVRQRAAHAQAIADLRGLDAPRYDRARAAADAVLKASTAQARELADREVIEILTNGEVSEGLNSEWDLLTLVQNAEARWSNHDLRKHAEAL